MTDCLWWPFYGVGQMTLEEMHVQIQAGDKLWKKTGSSAILTGGGGCGGYFLPRYGFNTTLVAVVFIRMTMLYPQVTRTEYFDFVNDILLHLLNLIKNLFFEVLCQQQPSSHRHSCRINAKVPVCVVINTILKYFM